MGARILHVSQPTTYGVAVWVRELVRAGIDHGDDVHVVSPAEGDLPTWTRHVGARWSELALARSPEVRDIVHLAELRRMARGVDLIHLHSSKAGAVGRGAMLALGRNRPACVFTPHSWSWLVGGRAAPVYRAFERAAAPFADAIVAVSRGERSAGARVLGRASRRMVVIENGTNTRHFRPDGELAERREEPLVVCVGRLSEQKGQDVAIQALGRMRTRNARLRLVGDGPEHAALGRLARRIDVGDRVELHGAVADAAPQFRAADIVVFPSRWEGLSVALLEAMSCGCAIVSSRVSGAEALEGCGVLVEPEDSEAMALALDELLADPSRRNALGASARARALASYDVEQKVGQTMRLYAEILERRAMRRGRRS